MTIKIEREALLTVLSRAPQQPLHQGVDEARGEPDDGFVLVSLPKPKRGCLEGESSVLLQRLSTCESFDDDDCCTVTSASTSSTSSFLEPSRSVSFAEPLVTEVRTRPRTLREEVSGLFYSVEETQRFRQEYRLERKLLAELDVDPALQAANEEQLSGLFETNEPASGRHSISRVVVLHNDKIETFCSPQPCQVDSDTQLNSDDFFDNDSFWSGSITWY